MSNNGMRILFFVFIIIIQIIHYIFVFVIDMEPDIADKKSDKQLIVKMAGYLEKKGKMVGIVDDGL